MSKKVVKPVWSRRGMEVREGITVEIFSCISCCDGIRCVVVVPINGFVEPEKDHCILDKGSLKRLPEGAIQETEPLDPGHPYYKAGAVRMA